MPEEIVARMPDAIRNIADDESRRLAWAFFVFFSRFEYALKRSPGYMMKIEGKPIPNWKKFATDYESEFAKVTTSNVLLSIEYFLADPPREQAIVDNKLGFKGAEHCQDKQHLLFWLIEKVRIIRNNLFHGGKFPGTKIAEPSRDRQLVSGAITILDACLYFNRDVKDRFLEEITS